MIINVEIEVDIVSELDATVSLSEKGSGADVTIYDINNPTPPLAQVPAGGSYGVLVFSGIIDDGAPYSNNIVNP